MSNNRLTTGQESLLVTPVDYSGAVITGAATTLILGIFRALNNGAGYSANDIIVLRQEGTNPPEWYNTNTNAVIATPLAADLGSVSAATNVTVSSALPTGANTIGAISNTSFIANAGTNLNTSSLALESGGNLASVNTKLPSNLTVSSNRLLVDNSGVTQPVSTVSLPLPTNAATESTLTTILTTSAFQARIPTGLTITSSRLLVDGSGVTQPVSIAAAIETQSRHTENTDTFTAPSVGASQVMNGYTRAFITLTIASINTNVVFRIEGSNDNTNWANLDINNQDTTFTANGTYAFTFEGCPQRIRVNFVSESGGTAATITAITRLAS